jgi:hypothetical protein
MSEGEANTKLTANLIPPAVTALQQAAILEGNSQTDTVNRTLQAYAFLILQQKAGKVILLRDEITNAVEIVRFL